MLRFTTAGLLIRAVVDSPSLSGLAGTDPRVVGAASWALGCFLAGLSGVMLTPLVGLDPTAFTLLIVASLAAVVVARLGSLALAFGGAILLGLIQELSVKYLPTTGVLSAGFRPSVPFIVMMVFLLAYQGFGQRPVGRREPGRHPQRDRRRGDDRAAGAVHRLRRHRRPRRGDQPAPTQLLGGHRRLRRVPFDRPALLFGRDRAGRHHLAVPDLLRRSRGHPHRPAGDQQPRAGPDRPVHRRPPRRPGRPRRRADRGAPR